jgi:spore coat protein H
MRRVHIGLLMALASSLTVSGVLASGCSSAPVDPPADAGADGDDDPDAEPDAGPDAQEDAKEDAPEDAPADAEPDAPEDAMPDAPADAEPDGGGGPGPFTFPPHPSDAVFDPKTLHQVVITVDPSKLAQLDSDLENRVPCSITYDGVTVDNVGLVKVPDNGVVDPLAGKPSFSVKLNEFDANKDLFTLSRFTLQSSISDPSLLREHLGYEMYRRAAIPAKRTGHASVTFNGVVLGVYVVADYIDKKFSARNFGPENFDGNLYEGGCCGDFVDGIAHMDLKNEASEGRSRIDILALEKTLKTASPEDFAAKVDQRMDLARFVTGYALDALLVHKNGYHYLPISNFFMYDNPADGRFVFLPSGMDDVLSDLNFNPFTAPDAFPSKKVRGIPALDTQYRAALLHVMNDLWDTDFLHARIDAVTALMDQNPANDPHTLADIEGYKAHVGDTHLAVDLRKSKVLTAVSAVCGNGALEGFEACDDGNQAPGDGCNAVCMKEVCGDGVVQPALGEVCDGPGCAPDCSSLSVCGNMVKEQGEQCDDGNIDAGDGCSASCVLEACTVLANQGKSYAFCTDLHTAPEARAVCAAAGGALAVPQNDAENTWMTTTAFGLFAQGYWIGVDDEAFDGMYKKPDGSAQAYLPWAPGQPNGGPTQNCLIISFVLSGGWNDKACTETNGYICALP